MKQLSNIFKFEHIDSHREEYLEDSMIRTHFSEELSLLNDISRVVTPNNLIYSEGTLNKGVLLEIYYDNAFLIKTNGKLLHVSSTSKVFSELLKLLLGMYREEYVPFNYDKKLESPICNIEGIDIFKRVIISRCLPLEDTKMNINIHFINTYGINSTLPSRLISNKLEYITSVVV